MRILATFVGFLLMMGGFPTHLQERQLDTSTCGFNVQGEPTRPIVAGPDDIVPLVYVVEQPDSPIEIFSMDRSGMWLSFANERHTENHCVSYKVRNRSDRVVQRFGIGLLVVNGSGSGESNSSPLAPGQTIEIKSCNGGGSGGAPGNHVRLLTSVTLVDFGDCLYRPSQRIPRSLGVHPVW